MVDIFLNRYIKLLRFLSIFISEKYVTERKTYEKKLASIYENDVNSEEITRKKCQLIWRKEKKMALWWEKNKLFDAFSLLGGHFSFRKYKQRFVKNIKGKFIAFYFHLLCRKAKALYGIIRRLRPRGVSRGE